MLFFFRESFFFFIILWNKYFKPNTVLTRISKKRTFLIWKLRSTWLLCPEFFQFNNYTRRRWVTRLITIDNEPRITYYFRRNFIILPACVLRSTRITWRNIRDHVLTDKLITRLSLREQIPSTTMPEWIESFPQNTS